MDRSKPAAQLNIETLIEETLVLVASPDHPLTEKPHILPNDLRDVTVLLTEKGCSYREVLEQFIQPQGIEPNNQIEFVSIEAIKQCVMADLGIAILPKMAVTRELYNGEMKALTWTPPIAPMYTHLAWHKDKRLTEPLQAFLELTRAVFI
ncbi:transcriptional regulator, LysR family [Geomicrobium sp. JCM 19037]|nr:transcriptional regulator, LysR family [Geomicrobium sp. JCM 19037]